MQKTWAMFFAVSASLTLGMSVVAAAPGDAARHSGQTAQAPQGQSNGVTMNVTAAEAAEIQRRRESKSQEYNRALNQYFPLSPDQIGQTRHEIDRRKRAMREGPAPKNRPQTVRVNLGIDADIPKVSVAAGYGAALTVLDATGKPWPVQSITLGDDNAFLVNKAVSEGESSSILTVVPKTAYAKSNLIMQLEDMPTPVNVRLAATTDVNNGRTDIIIGARGPNAVAPVAHRRLAQPDNSVMGTLLDGVPPQGATRVSIGGGPANGWIVGNSFFVRTPLQVTSPAWLASVTGSGGVTVYEMPIVPTIYASDSDGVTIKLSLPDSVLVDGALAMGSTTLGAIHYGPRPASK
jgi:intracellular multiplication protein IcmK